MLALMLCALQDLAPREDATEQEEVRLTWVAEPERPFVGQRVTLTLECRIAPEFRAAHLVQPFARPVDVPVDIRLGDWPSALGEPVLRSGDLEVVLAGRTTMGNTLSDGVALVWDAVCERGGEVVVPAAEGWYSRTSEFREDLLLGPVPVDRMDLRVRSEALQLQVLDAPEEDRPPEWTGAIGELEVWARVKERRLDRDAPVELSLEFEGPGDPGDLSAWPHHIQGWRITGRTTIADGTLNLTLIRDADVDEVPPITLYWLDPETERFERAASEPIPIVWNAPPAKEAVGAGDIGPYADSEPDDRGDPGGFLSGGLPLGGVLLGGIVGLAALAVALRKRSA